MSSGATSISDSLLTLSEYRKQAHLRGQKDVLTSMARFDFGFRACISLITAPIRPKTASNPVHSLKFASEASRREHFYVKATPSYFSPYAKRLTSSSENPRLSFTLVDNRLTSIYAKFIRGL